MTAAGLENDARPGWVKILFEPADLKAGRFDQIRERAAKMVKLVKESPGGS